MFVIIITQEPQVAGSQETGDIAQWDTSFKPQNRDQKIKYVSKTNKHLGPAVVHTCNPSAQVAEAGGFL